MRLALLAIFILTACNSGTIAEVGRYKLTQKDADYRDKLIQLYSPEDKRKLGLKQLIDSYISAEILNNNGHAITDETVAKEEERINRETQMPEFLSRIKAIFGTDHEGYRRVYVLPTYADRIIYYTFFLHDPKIQQESLNQARNFLDEAKRNPSQFAELAEKRGLKVAKFVISLKEGLIWEQDLKERKRMTGAGKMQIAESPEQMKIQAKMKAQQNQQQNEEAKKWIQEVIQPLKPGQMHDQIADRGEHWQVTRYIRPLPRDEYEMETVMLSKADYGKWYEAEKAKIKIVKPKESHSP